MKKESDLYLPVKEFLDISGYDVFAEVKVLGGRADVIGYKNDHDVVAVEMKTTLSKTLVDQAIKRRKFFHQVYIAIPERKQTIAEIVLHRLTFHGIGILEVVDHRKGAYVKVTHPAAKIVPSRKFKKKWDDMLLPQHQTWVEGGSAGGGYVTDYKLSMEIIKKYLKENYDRDMQKNIEGEPSAMGWTRPKAIAENCRGLHWSNPAVGMIEPLKFYETAWVESEKLNGRWYFRYKGDGVNDL